MKTTKIIALLLVLATCIALCSCMPNLRHFAIQFAQESGELTEEELNDAEYIEFLSKISDFSARLSEKMYRNAGYKKNFCISPIAVYSALAIACESSDGETRDQLLDAIGVTYDEVLKFTNYLNSYANRKFYCEADGKSDETAHSKLVSSVWLDTSVLYKNGTVDILANKFGCDVYGASFSNGDAQKMINQYVEYKTHDTVKSNLSFDRSTALSIISAYHLKEVWSDIGGELALTLEKYDFENGNESISSINMLKSEYTAGVVYKGTKYSTFFVETQHGFKLHFILPNEGYDADDVFTEGIISQILSRKNFGAIDEEKGTVNYTRILFPSFEASFSGDISKVLAEGFGITDLFDPQKCDLSGLLSSRVHLDKLTHQSELSIGKNGIHASAELFSPDSSVPDDSEYTKVYHEFIIDRSFGFILTDDRGTVLYSGVIDNVE